MKTFEANDTIYQTTEVKVKGQTYDVTVASGRFNYVSILKTSNNPFGAIGRQFKDFSEAAAAYKLPEMKIALLKVEIGINQ